MEKEHFCWDLKKNVHDKVDSATGNLIYAPGASTRYNMFFSRFVRITELS